tara:strand:- start:311 stop:574 length:264 start_codon:yes stop_codon:yes gene_type:complete
VPCELSYEPSLGQVGIQNGALGSNPIGNDSPPHGRIPFSKITGSNAFAHHVHDRVFKNKFNGKNYKGKRKKDQKSDVNLNSFLNQFN